MELKQAGSDVINILIVDDDPETRSLLVEILGQDYHLVLAADPRQAIEAARRNRLHLALVDVRLPEMSGLDLLLRLRALDPQMGAILITAHGRVSDAVRALRDLEALDFLEKPISPPEMRQRVARALNLLQERHQVSLGDIILNRQACQCERDGKVVPLTPQEFGLLLYLACRKGRTVSYEELLRRVWGLDPSVVQEQNVRRAVSRLRRKLQEGSNGRSYIQTVWGIGYQAQD